MPGLLLDLCSDTERATGVPAAARRDEAEETKTERAVKEELKRIGWHERDLPPGLKGGRDKVAMAGPAGLRCLPGLRNQAALCFVKFPEEFDGTFRLDIHSVAMYSAPMIEKELVAASTEPLILSLLARGESYGYELSQAVKQLSGDKIQWTDGMLYPVLHRMEANGWIKSHWVEMENGRKRKYYSIKTDGRTALKAKRAQWSLVSGVLGGLWKEQNV